MTTVLIYENNTVVEKQPALRKITLKNLNLDENLFQLDEENMSEDFEQLASSEEEIPVKQLKSSITLTKKEYRNKGVNLDRWLSQSHIVDFNLFSEMLENITQSFWSKTLTFIDVLTRVFTVLWTVLTVLFIVQGGRNLINSCRKNEGSSIEA